MRNGTFVINCLALLLLPSGVLARGPEEIKAGLQSLPDYKARATYAVTLPQAQDDVVYTLFLQQPAGSDAYLTDWIVETPSGTQSGFTAWFDGNYYNYRNRRLQELHGATEQRGQFANLLPYQIGEEIATMLAQPERFKLTLHESPTEVRLDAVRHSNGDTDAELTWKFDPETLRPLSFYGDYNPGAISGQQVTVTYLETPDEPADLTEAGLRQRWPEVFELYRESTFSVEQLKGQPLPAFSLQLADMSGRLTHEPGEAFSQNTWLAILDPEATLAPKFVESVRHAADLMPVPVSVIWAVSSRNPEQATELLGQLRQDETAVIGAKSLATELGAPTLPLLIRCDAHGTVQGVTLGVK